MTRNRQIEIEGVREDDEHNNRRFKLERELWEGEKTDLLRKMKELNRKIEEIQYDVKIVEEQNLELKSDKNKLQIETGDKDIKYRDSLRNVQSDAQDPASQKYLSREQLTKTLQDAEKKLQEKLAAKEKRNNDLVQKQRALIRWGIQLKNVAEDRIGLNEPTPEILLRPPPVSLDQDDDDS